MTKEFVYASPSPGEPLSRQHTFWPGSIRLLPGAIKTVLLAEDNEDDVFAMTRACEHSGVPHQLQVVTDGVAAIEYLSDQETYGEHVVHPRPTVIFLDITMPKKNGFEVLEFIRATPGIKNIPVVMLTGSALATDVDRAYDLGVTSYLRKVSDQTALGNSVAVILKYWLELYAPSR